MGALSGSASRVCPLANVLDSTAAGGAFCGSPVLKEARERAKALHREWCAIQQNLSADGGAFDTGVPGSYIRILLKCN